MPPDGDERWANVVCPYQGTGFGQSPTPRFNNHITDVAFIEANVICPFFGYFRQVVPARSAKSDRLAGQNLLGRETTRFAEFNIFPFAFLNQLEARIQPAEMSHHLLYQIIRC